MKNLNQFIPINNNNLNKVIAFAPSLDVKYRKRNRIFPKREIYIETTDILRGLQKEGWKVNGVCEHRDKQTRKIDSQYVRLHHPDFTIKNKNKIEGISNLYITNSCDGSGYLKFEFGLFREVCSNQLVKKNYIRDHSIPHSKQGLEKIPQILSNINNETIVALNIYENLKHKELTQHQISKLALQAVQLRFGNKTKINSDQLLQVHRPEDEGNTLWLTYQRIQENLTKSNLLVNVNGKLISGVEDVKQNIKLNQDLFELVEEFI